MLTARGFRRHHTGAPNLRGVSFSVCSDRYIPGERLTPGEHLKLLFWWVNPWWACFYPPQILWWWWNDFIFLWCDAIYLFLCEVILIVVWGNLLCEATSHILYFFLLLFLYVSTCACSCSPSFGIIASSDPWIMRLWRRFLWRLKPSVL